MIRTLWDTSATDVIWDLLQVLPSNLTRFFSNPINKEITESLTFVQTPNASLHFLDQKVVLGKDIEQGTNVIPFELGGSTKGSITGSNVMGILGFSGGSGSGSGVCASESSNSNISAKWNQRAFSKKRAHRWPKPGKGCCCIGFGGTNKWKGRLFKKSRKHLGFVMQFSTWALLRFI